MIKEPTKWDACWDHLKSSFDHSCAECIASHTQRLNVTEEGKRWVGNYYKYPYISSEADMACGIYPGGITLHPPYITDDQKFLVIGNKRYEIAKGILLETNLDSAGNEWRRYQWANPDKTGFDTWLWKTGGWKEFDASIQESCNKPKSKVYFYLPAQTDSCELPVPKIKPEDSNA